MVYNNISDIFQMAPGPKKKGFNKRGGETPPINKSIKNNQVPVAEIKNSTTVKDNESDLDGITSQSQKYNKRSITSNWSKYDEPAVDPHADTLRGESFEVLLSYCGGSNSQLQFQDEKEWEDSGVGEKTIALDLQDLALALKSIPLHQRINVPDGIFDANQVDRFNSQAVYSKSLYMSKSDLPPIPATKAVSEKVEVLDESLNIIESSEPEETVGISIKSPALDVKSENIIESLASCLSLKNNAKEKIETSITATKPDASSDELDFLLTLSVTSDAANLANKQMKPDIKKPTNVDDWLNSLLDE